MSEETDAAAQYRQHAEDLRTISTEAFDPKTKKALLKIASDYERMAESMDAIEQTNAHLRRVGIVSTSVRDEGR
jgi:hypothetical protein